jgi:hypothetical protein
MTSAATGQAPPRRQIIEILVGSVREGRKSLPIAQWVHERAALREELQTEVVDLADWPLPMFAFAKPPAMGLSGDPAQWRWAEKIGAADGYTRLQCKAKSSESIPDDQDIPWSTFPGRSRSATSAVGCTERR